ncbi:fumarylacetoacetate hydrolase family protein [Streptosporangium sp. 'caverna']|uniref:fumarylacetoacetate hydrolase family protein n=1 Tax=Streptosporangium sp. 'caverna' TaxID=2202249 RepID=UPI000D7D6D2E|nr:fumarylacetoacetate hydrolase family protein [Streptosporangium sp. 'caverna']AWS43650.1 fumarylacetoacetate hydrolase [Streptosporangium sp. 'caverna']
MKLAGVQLTRDDTVHVARLDGDIVHIVTDVARFWTDARGWTAKAARLSGEGLPAESVRFTPPVPPSARVICVGLNYRAHAAEGSFEVPEYPTLFGRWTASLSVGDVPVPVPTGEAGLDWEGEVAAYIAEPLIDADSATAQAAVLGYSTFNDLTARRAQKLTTQWTLGKNADHSGPMGPIVTADEVGDLRDGLRLQTRVNGTVVQDGNTRDMIFSVGDVLSLISRTFQLNPGDVIATGTPDGVGYVRTPPWLLQPGDVVEIEIDRLGTLRTPIASRNRQGKPR